MKSETSSIELKLCCRGADCVSAKVLLLMGCSCALFPSFIYHLKMMTFLGNGPGQCVAFRTQGGETFNKKTLGISLDTILFASSIIFFSAIVEGCKMLFQF